jgi:hypothetical protein
MAITEDRALPRYLPHSTPPSALGESSINPRHVPDVISPTREEGDSER